jgi:hypothetical protein
MQTVPLDLSVAMIPDGASLMIGGFMGVERVIDEIVRQGRRSLTVIANDTTVPGRGIGKLGASERCPNRCRTPPARKSSPRGIGPDCVTQLSVHVRCFR